MIDLELAQRMKKLTRKKKLRQKELAARLGMDYQKVNKALNGRAPVYAQELPRYAAALETRMEALLGLEER